MLLLGPVLLLPAGCTALRDSQQARDIPPLSFRSLPPAVIVMATNDTAPRQSAEASVPAVTETTSLSNTTPVMSRARSVSPATSLAFRQLLAVQAFLDRNNYSCGCADGAFGPRTRQALQAWQTGNGLPVTGKLDSQTLEMIGNLEDALTIHVVTAEEIAALTPVPPTWREKSTVTTLGYETILEFVAEKYHASQDAIRRLNPNITWPDPPEGTMLNVPNSKGISPSKAAQLTISLKARSIRAYDTAGNLIALFPCSIGQNENKRPVGELKVQNCASNPDFTFDPEVFPESGETRKYLIPPGPNNPVGAAWIGLSLPGYGIHGTPRPEDIGKTESHGCFRLANWNVQKLLKMITIGTPVIVQP